MTGLFAQPKQPGQSLDGFAQAHVVSENTAEMVGGEIGQEMKTFELIGPQLRRDSCGQLGRDAGFNFAGAALDLLDLLRRKLMASSAHG